MNAVGKLGSYFSTVSGPFHPFGGAVDIIVVQQQDGSFRSSPWYVRFGKFQGVLKTNEKVVSISVNGIEADFQMNLDHKGQAFFLREVEVEDAESLVYPSSSGEDTDGQSSSRRVMKSKTCNYGEAESNSTENVDLCNGKVVARTNSRRGRIFGFVFGRKSMKENGSSEDNSDTAVVRADSLERAELAADLLEMKWSTNLASTRRKKDNASQRFVDNVVKYDMDIDLQISDRQNKIDSIMQEKNINEMYFSIPSVKTDYADHTEGLGTNPEFQKLENSVEAAGPGTSSVCHCMVETYTFAESDGEHSKLYPISSREEVTLDAAIADHNDAGKVASDLSADSQMSDAVELQNFPSKKLDQGQILSDEHDDLAGSLSKNELGDDKIQLALYPETLVSSPELDGSSGLDNGSMCLSGEEHMGSLPSETELVTDMISDAKAGLLDENSPRNPENLAGDGKCSKSFGDDVNFACKEMNLAASSLVMENYSKTGFLHSLDSTVKELELRSVFSIASLGNSDNKAQIKNGTRKEGHLIEYQLDREPVDNSLVSGGICGQMQIPASEISADKQLVFGDLDDFKLSEIRQIEDSSVDPGKKVFHSAASSKHTDDELFNASMEKSRQENLTHDVKNLTKKLRVVSSDVNMLASNEVKSKKIERMARSLPNLLSSYDNRDQNDLAISLDEPIRANPKMCMCMVPKKDVPSSKNSSFDNYDPSSQIQKETGDGAITKEPETRPPNPEIGVSSKTSDPSGESRRIWSFPFKGSKSMKISQSGLNSNEDSGAQNTPDRSSGNKHEKDLCKMKPTKTKTRANTPTSEELASLRLKEGKNVVVFTFSTAMLGKQQVDARIFLWRWDARVVISDVDGTITRSDLLGQFMPLVGVDWSQTGVAHLFSAIKENGYQLLFLSARAISQAYHTRQFLFNLKQDGKALPDGPVVISPDGLFPSLFREVVRRAPHEFKISCLEGIKALFPPDRNPFYAGFGNRDTDEISYLKVGMPKGKVFIINPKGEIIVNRRVDRKSYTSLHALVHGMFPPAASFEQEDFNSWNFWKLPLPAIEI